MFFPLSNGATEEVSINDDRPYHLRLHEGETIWADAETGWRLDGEDKQRGMM